MTKEIIQLIHRWRTEVKFEPGTVLEVGSYNVNGTIRECFRDATRYIGIDQSPGPGVDQVLPAELIINQFKQQEFDTVLCCEMLEHCVNPVDIVQQMIWVLKPKGHLLITSPDYNFPVHRHPKDYWRIGEDTYRDIFFKDFELLRLDVAREHTGYQCICALGQKR